MGNQNTKDSQSLETCMVLSALAYLERRGEIESKLHRQNPLRASFDLTWFGSGAGTQVFVASPTGSADCFVAIRGSVIDPLSEAFWIDWLDLDARVFRQVAWPFADDGLAPDVQIAKGSSDGLRELAALRDSVTAESLIDHLVARSSGVIAVTGHSLGGALATGFAVHLRHRVQGTVLATTFAAPTVGNAAFARAAETALPSGALSRVVNTLDDMPQFWSSAGLTAVIDSYRPGPRAPWLMRVALEAVQAWLKSSGIDYEHAFPDAAIELHGTLQHSNRWFEEVATQHSTATYLALLGVDSRLASCSAVAVGASAPAAPITIEYDIAGGATQTDRFETLVIACDPRNLLGICDFTADEKDVFDRLSNYTFHTTLLEVDLAGSKLEHAVIFAPTSVQQMAGDVYAFRNESAKQFGIEVAATMKRNLVTVYQIAGDGSGDWPASRFEALLKQQLATVEWWPFARTYDVVTSVTTPYFSHFDQASLEAGVPWRVLDGQGRHDTIYAHAFTCFESVWNCWSYAELMMECVPGAKAALPEDRNGAIAILGAGPSGLLFALRLAQLGYRNVRLFESTDRYGGKTHTIVRNGPFPAGSNEPTVCELGTCYLSPSYVPMTTALAPYLVDNEQIDFVKKAKNFRGVVTKGQFPPDYKVDPIIDYDDYVSRKAAIATGFSDPTALQAAVLFELVKYTYLHNEFMGGRSPMPRTPPEEFLKDHGSKTFAKYLSEHGLDGLVGMLQYGYEVQGYGSLDQIPAYYGLLWITPAITNAIVLDALKLSDEPIVTAWSKGWGDLWDQIVAKERLNVSLRCRTHSIRRAGITR